MVQTLTWTEHFQLLCYTMVFLLVSAYKDSSVSVVTVVFACKTCCWNNLFSKVLKYLLYRDSKLQRNLKRNRNPSYRFPCFQIYIQRQMISTHNALTAIIMEELEEWRWMVTGKTGGKKPAEQSRLTQPERLML